MINLQAMQSAGAKKKQAKPLGDVLPRYMTGGAWLNNMSTGKPSRALKGINITAQGKA